MITFESPRKWANRFFFMLGLLGICAIASIILTLFEISLLERIQAGEEVTDSDIDALDNLGIILAILLIVTYVGCAVLFLMWKQQSSKNLAPLGVSNQRFSPGWWVVWYYLIPILNWFRPYQAMKEIYLRSRADAASTPSYSIVTAWWCLWLILWIIDGYFLFQLLNLRENDIDAHIKLNYTSIVLDFLTIVAGILVFVVVRRITENQETSWMKIEETKEIRVPPLPPKSFPSGSN